jgi:signal transduction histidine kinase
MRHSRSWWAAVLLPVAILGGIELLADWVLDPYLPFPLDTIVVTATALFLALLLVTVARRRFNLLAGALDARTRELEKRGATARALHQLGVAISATHDLDAVLAAVVDNTRQLLEADVAFVLLEGGETSRLSAASGPDEAFLQDASDVLEPADVVTQPCRRSLVAAPLHRATATIGSLAVGSRHERAFEVDELETLSSLASLLTLAIENARLEGQLRELAVRGERERIAREMHDGLAQVLGYVNTKSQAVEELLRQERTDEARSQLTELAAAARSIYVDVREAILGLTSPVTPERGLVGALEEYATRYATAAKIAVSVEASPEASAVDLSAETEAQVFRVVQEALTNVRKHASAARVRIEVACQGSELAVSVTDDGRGFAASPPGHDLAAGERGAAGGEPAWPHYGIAAMRERASAIGGALEIGSGPDGGTRVLLRLPVGRAVAVAGDPVGGPA